MLRVIRYVPLVCLILVHEQSASPPPFSKNNTIDKTRNAIPKNKN